MALVPATPAFLDRGHPEDVAFLAGPSASFITGQSLHVDGGRLLH
ncbi:MULTISPECIES: hypothetical protein [unclassified Kitasatospora]